MSELNSTVRHGTSVWQQNPVLIHLLGLSPLLALSSSVLLAALMLISLCVILILGTVSDEALARYFPLYRDSLWRLPVLALVLTVPSSFLDWLLATYLPEAHAGLGIYVLLLCCNFAVLVHLQTQNAAIVITRRLLSALELLGGYTVVLLSLAAIRELLAYGRLFHDSDALFSDSLAAGSIQAAQFFGFAATQPAALLILGLIAAAARQATIVFASRRKDPNSDISPPIRARVTEKLQ